MLIVHIVHACCGSRLTDAPIAAERVALAPVTPDDAEALYQVLRDPRLGVFTGDDPPPDVAAMRATIERWVAHDPADPERWRNWLVRRGGDGRVVGHIQATVRGMVAELAWVIAVEMQRRGYATEAARAAARSLRDDDGIGTLEATIMEGHVASEGVARHLGLEVTDEVRDGERVWRRPVP